MATKILKSIKGKVVRLTRLDSCGNVAIGSCSTLVSECFVSATLSPEIEAGEDYLQKSAYGDLCISDRDPDQIRWYNVTIEFAEINPDALDIVGGTTPIINSGDTIGTWIGQTTNEDSFALEIWTKRTGVDCATGSNQEWGYFVLPYVRNGRVEGDITIENGVLTMSVMGMAFPAPANWGLGPYTANPIPVAMPGGELLGIAVTTTQPPADTNGCVAYTGS
jgi:hypothetical protein